MLLWKFYRAVDTLLQRFVELFGTLPELAALAAAVNVQAKAGCATEDWTLAETVLVPHLVELREPKPLWTDHDLLYKEIISKWTSPENHEKWMFVWERIVPPADKACIRAELRHLCTYARILRLLRPKYAAADHLLRLFTAKLSANGFDMGALFESSGSHLSTLGPLFNALTRDHALEIEFHRVLQNEIGWDVGRQALAVLELPPIVQVVLDRILCLSQQASDPAAAGVNPITQNEIRHVDDVINTLDWRSLLTSMMTAQQGALPASKSSGGASAGSSAGTSAGTAGSEGTAGSGATGTTTTALSPDQLMQNALAPAENHLGSLIAALGNCGKTASVSLPPPPPPPPPLSSSTSSLSSAPAGSLSTGRDDEPDAAPLPSILSVGRVKGQSLKKKKKKKTNKEEEDRSKSKPKKGLQKKKKKKGIATDVPIQDEKKKGTKVPERPPPASQASPSPQGSQAVQPQAADLLTNTVKPSSGTSFAEIWQSWPAYSSSASNAASLHPVPPFPTDVGRDMSALSFTDRPVRPDVSYSVHPPGGGPSRRWLPLQPTPTLFEQS